MRRELHIRQGESVLLRSSYGIIASAYMPISLPGTSPTVTHKLWPSLVVLLPGNPQEGNQLWV